MERHESLENKIYLPRAVEGEVSHDAIAIVREFERAYEAHPLFIGVVPFGSSFKGYAVESSDVDIRIIIDISKEVDVEEQRRFHASIRAFSGKLQQKYGRPIEVSVEWIKPEKLFQNIKEDRLSDEDLTNMADLSAMVIGKKVKEYRTFFAQALHQLPPDTQRKIMQRLLVLIMEEWKGGETWPAVWKMVDRGVLASGKADPFVKKRETLWRKRLERVWGVTGLK